MLSDVCILAPPFKHVSKKSKSTKAYLLKFPRRLQHSLLISICTVKYFISNLRLLIMTSIRSDFAFTMPNSLYTFSHVIISDDNVLNAKIIHHHIFSLRNRIQNIFTLNFEIIAYLSVTFKFWFPDLGSI